jgi:putative RecB family exonuclease
MNASVSTINRPGELLDYISASRLNTWLTCREKFRLQYILGVGQEYSPSLHLGKCVHGALEFVHESIKVGDALNTELVLRIYDTLYQNPEKEIDWKDDAHKKRLFDTGCNLIVAYLSSEYLEKVTQSQLPVIEKSLESSDSRLPMRLVGTVDLIRGNVLTDFKTVASTPSDLEMELFRHRVQLMAYQVLCESHRIPIKGFELVFLVKTKTPKILSVARNCFSPEEMEEFYSLCSAYAASLHRDNAIKSPAQHCDWCGYRQHCVKRNDSVNLSI